MFKHSGTNSLPLPIVAPDLHDRGNNLKKSCVKCGNLINLFKITFTCMIHENKQDRFLSLNL